MNLNNLYTGRLTEPRHWLWTMWYFSASIMLRDALNGCSVNPGPRGQNVPGVALTAPCILFPQIGIGSRFGRPVAVTPGYQGPSG